MKKLLLLFCSAFLPYLLLAQASEKISHDLWQSMLDAPQADQNIMIMLADQVDTRALLDKFETEKPSLEYRSYETITQLQAKAQATQPDLINRLNRLNGVDAGSIKSVWITNALFLTANAQAIQTMSTWNEIGEIGLNDRVEFEQPVNTEPVVTSPNGTEPGLRAVKAPFMWGLGYTGYGHKILVIDTGEEMDHPALRDGFWWHQVPKSQSWNGSAYPEDCDQEGGHGSHVTGTVCGLDRTTNDTIGVAYNAHWMGGPLPNTDGCSPFNQTVFNVTTTMQWAMNPDGNAQTSADMPDAINCSFNSGQFSCTTTNTINILNALEAAGIAVVWSGGNSGPGAQTVISGASINTDLVNSFAVGAVNGANPNFPIANFSSRGPTPCGGTGSLSIKPEVSAPGVNVRSCMKGGGYMSIDGTSMAAPHASGCVVILKEAFPTLSGIEIKMALYNSADDLGIAGEDNTYGKGMINLENAYNYLINEGHTPVPPVAYDHDVILVNVEIPGKCNGPVVPVATFENSGTSNLTSLHFVYGLEGGTEFTYDWTGNLAPKAHITIELPGATGITEGDYTFVTRVESPNGQTDARTLNNQFKTLFTIVDDEYATAQVSATQLEPVCTNSQVLLEYTTDLEDNETVQWFSLPNSGSAIAEGNTFVTPPLTNNTTYYASTVFRYSGGKSELPNGNNGSSASNGLLFTADKDFVLKSVKVYAPETGGRLIQLLDNTGNVIGNKLVTITTPGENRINLNFNVPAGTGYFLTLISGKNLNHTSISPGYPHIIPDVINIYSGRTGSGANTIFLYYYFFDWEIEVPLECGRVAVPVTVSGSAAPNVDISGPDVVSLALGGTANFTDQTSGATSWSWDFGNGTTSTEQNPTATYTEAGTYTVQVMVTTSSGCVTYGTHTVEVVQTSSSFTPEFDPGSVMLFPNPAKQEVNLGFLQDTPNELRIHMVDMLGQTILTRQLSGQQNGSVLPLDVKELPAGVYFIQVNSGNTLFWTGKFVKE
jgi:PKD repeat protein